MWILQKSILVLRSKKRPHRQSTLSVSCFAFTLSVNTYTQQLWLVTCYQVENELVKQFQAVNSCQFQANSWLVWSATSDAFQQEVSVGSALRPVVSLGYRPTPSVSYPSVGNHASAVDPNPHMRDHGPQLVSSYKPFFYYKIYSSLFKLPHSNDLNPQSKYFF